jgi:hypothetical protein
LVLNNESLDCGRDCRRLIPPGQLVQPGAVVTQVLLHIADYVAPALPFMVARTFVVHIPKGPLDGLLIMHLQSVESHNHFPTLGGERLRAL